MTLISFGQYLLIKRQGLQLTQEEAASRMKINVVNLIRWEKDQAIPKAASLKKLMDFYKMKQEELEPYTKEDKLVFTKPNDRPIYHLIAKCNKALEFIDKYMVGESAFEKGVKNKAVTLLENMANELESIRIIDEAF